MRKINDYFGIVCFFCALVIGYISYRTEIKHKAYIEDLTIYYDAEVNKCDSVNQLNREWFVQDSIWHEAYKKIKH